MMFKKLFTDPINKNSQPWQMKPMMDKKMEKYEHPKGGQACDLSGNLGLIPS